MYREQNREKYSYELLIFQNRIATSDCFMVIILSKTISELSTRDINRNILQGLSFGNRNIQNNKKSSILQYDTC